MASKKGTTFQQYKKRWMRGAPAILGNIEKETYSRLVKDSYRAQKARFKRGLPTNSSFGGGGG